MTTPSEISWHLQIAVVGVAANSADQLQKPTPLSMPILNTLQLDSGQKRRAMNSTSG
jgi:hypothetical protein